jgi:hypothetical protein
MGRRVITLRSNRTAAASSLLLLAGGILSSEVSLGWRLLWVPAGLLLVRVGWLFARDAEEWRAQTESFLAWNGIRSNRRVVRLSQGFLTMIAGCVFVAWGALSALH